MRRLSFIILPVLVLAAGCHDDSGTGPAPAPTAAFTVGGAQQAGQATTFDASASTDPSAQGLSYTWDFGDGTRGGTSTVAHLYAQAGAYTVQLTVRDAAGKTAAATKSVTIAAGPAPTGTATLSGKVLTPTGQPLPGVAVSVTGSAASAQSAANGKVTLAGVPAGVPLVLRLTAPGYASQVVRLAAVGSGSTDGYFQAALRPRGAAVSLAAENGGTAAGAAGAQVVLGAGALVRADGTSATGPVDVAITPVDVATQPEAFPGTLVGVEPGGGQTPLATLGVMEVVLSQSGQPLQLAPGHTATVELPVYTGGAAAGQTVPIWSLDEASGLWVQEGTGTVVANGASPTGLALRAKVSHFTWWNVDVPYASPFTVNVRCFTHDAAGNLVPLATGCWVRARQLQGTTPRTSATLMLNPFERRALPLFPNVTTVIEGAALYGGVGSVTVSGSGGTSQNVDIVLSQPTAPPAAVDVRLVVVGAHSSSRILSSEGVGWYPNPSPMTAGYAVAWNGSIWVAAGGFGGTLIAVSLDGVTWTPASFVPPSITHVRALAWNGSMWVAGGGSSGSSFTGLLTSTNGNNWSAQAPPPNGGPISSIAWNGVEWLAASDGLGLIQSPDGAAWQHRASPMDGAYDARIAWNGARWVAVGHDVSGNSIFMTSTDGVNWSTQGVPLANARAVAWNGSYWLAGGKQGLATSANGTSWTVVPLPAAFEIWDIAWTGSGWAAVGTGATSGLLMTSGDAATWTVTALPLANSARGIAYRRPLYPPFP